MEFENKKGLVGIAVVGAGFIVKEVRNRQKLKELEWKIKSMNKSMRIFADIHNGFVDKVTKDYEQMDDLSKCLLEDAEINNNEITDLAGEIERVDNRLRNRIDEIENEIGYVYEHIEQLVMDEK